MNKKLTILSVFVTSVFFLSCQKQTVQTNPGTSRTIKFILYTNKDFSTINDTITFSLFARNQSNGVLLDSALASIRIKDIPGPSNKLVFTKTVPDDGSVLTVGFLYTIKNVGYSWYLDTVGVNTKTKVMEYPFQ